MNRKPEFVAVETQTTRESWKPSSSHEEQKRKSGPVGKKPTSFSTPFPVPLLHPCLAPDPAFPDGHCSNTLHHMLWDQVGGGGIFFEALQETVVSVSSDPMVFAHASCTETPNPLCVACLRSALCSDSHAHSSTRVGEARSGCVWGGGGQPCQCQFAGDRH